MTSTSAGGNASCARSAPRDPPHLLTLLRRGIAHDVAADEVDFDRAIRVGVGRREQFLADARLDGELFAQLARQARRVVFARLALAAGKLPVAFEVHAALAPA